QMNKTFFKSLGKNTLEYSKQGLGFLVAFPIMLIIFSVFLAFIIGIPAGTIYGLYALGINNDFITRLITVEWFIILYGITRSIDKINPFVKIKLIDYLLSILYLTTFSATCISSSVLLFKLSLFAEDINLSTALLSFMLFLAANRGTSKIAIKSYK